MRVRMLTTFEDPRRPDVLKGGYRRCVEMAKLLARHLDVAMLNASRQPVQPFADLAEAGVRWESLVAPRFSRRVALTAWQLLRLTRPGDLVLAYNPSLAASPAVLAALAGRHLVIDYVDEQGVNVAPTLLHRATRGLRGGAAAAMVRSTRWFVTSSATIEREICAARPGARVHRYCGTIERDHPGSPATRDLAEPDAGPLRLLYIGAMLDVSGADDAVAAVTALPPGVATLELAGAGPHRPVVAAAIARSNGRATMITLDDQELHPALANAELLVLPLRRSRRNDFNFPSRTVEYLWAGRPLLATDIPPLEGFLRHGENAWVVPHGVEALAAGIRHLAADAALRARLAENARRFFLENLAPAPSAKALADFLREAVSAEPG